MSAVVPIFKFPSMDMLTEVQARQVHAVAESFGTAEVITALTHAHLERSHIEDDMWLDFIEATADDEPNAAAKKSIKKWKFKKDQDSADIILTADFDQKASSFRFQLRAFKKRPDNQDIEYMEAMIIQDFKVIHQSKNPGFFKNVFEKVANFAAGDSYKTTQMAQDDKESLLAAALCDTAVMNRFVGLNFKGMLHSCGIQPQEVRELPPNEA